MTRPSLFGGEIVHADPRKRQPEPQAEPPPGTPPPPAECATPRLILPTQAMRPRKPHWRTCGKCSGCRQKAEATIAARRGVAFGATNKETNIHTVTVYPPPPEQLEWRLERRPLVMRDETKWEWTTAASNHEIIPRPIKSKRWPSLLWAKSDIREAYAMLEDERKT